MLSGVTVTCHQDVKIIAIKANNIPRKWKFLMVYQICDFTALQLYGWTTCSVYSYRWLKFSCQWWFNLIFSFHFWSTQLKFCFLELSNNIMATVQMYTCTFWCIYLVSSMRVQEERNLSTSFARAKTEDFLTFLCLRSKLPYFTKYNSAQLWIQIEEQQPG